MVQKLGEGAYGCVHLVKHKLDSVLYALKKIKIHMEFNDNDSREDRKMALLNHPAMKEIQAISKLSHKNIVGYKGCWVESEDADLDRIHRIRVKAVIFLSQHFKNEIYFFLTFGQFYFCL